MDQNSMAFSVNETGMSVSLHEASFLRVFVLQAGEWIAVRELDLWDLESLGGLVHEIMRFLADCLTLVAPDLSGPEREELERGGIGIWELAGDPCELAELIWSEESAELAGGIAVAA